MAATLRAHNAATWHEVRRKAAAARLPSDFSVLAVDKHAEAAVLATLRASGGVRYVRPQHRIRDGLAGAIVPEAVGSAVPSERKSTRPSARMGAYALWAKGYTGAHIKVAIFDTG